MKKQIAQKIEKTKKPLRRILSAILALCVFCTALPFTAITVQAADDTTYTSGDYKYRILDDGTAEITDYTGSATNLTLPSRLDGYPVTSIGDNSFRSCSTLESVTISNSIINLGDYAFYDCVSLESITIPNGVTSIGYSAFFSCDSLESITIPDSVTNIEYAAFGNCWTLESIAVDANNQYYSDIDGVLFNKEQTTLIQYPVYKTQTTYVIPDNVTSIGDDAFAFCNSSEITIPDSVTSIGDGAFCGAALKSITIPDSVTSIGDWAFWYCSALESITIPNSVTGIGYAAFAFCNSLESITIPDSVISIGDWAFSNCDSLERVTISNSVTSIGADAFYWCSALQDVYYGGSEEEWEQISIEAGNEDLLNATIHYGSTGPKQSVNDLSSGIVTLNLLNEHFLSTQPIFSSEDAVLRSVTMQAGSKTDTVSKTATLSSVNAGQRVVLSKDGFNDYIIPAKVVNSWLEEASSVRYCIKNVYMNMGALPDEPYISTVFARLSDGDGVYIDVVNESVVASTDEKYDLVLSAGEAGSGATYYLSQDDAHRLSNKTGVFSSVDLVKTFEAGKDVYAYVKTASGMTSDPVKLQLSITDMTLPKDEFALLGKDGQSITFDKDAPIIGGSKVSLEGFKFPLGLEISGSHFKISFGVDVFSLKNSGAQWKNDTWSSFKKSVSTLKSSVSDSTKKLKEYDKFLKKYGGGSKNSKTKDFDVNMIGYAEGNIVNGEFIYTDFCGDIALKYKFKYTAQGTIVGFPVYGSVTAGIDAGVTLGGIRSLPDTEVPFDFSAVMDIEPSLKLGVGLGVKDAVSAGLYGKGSIPFMADFTQKHIVVDLKGEIGIEAELGPIKLPDIVLVDGKLSLVDKWYGRSSKRISYALPAFGKSVTVQPASSSGKTAYSVADRSYLDDMSVWLDKGVFKRLTRAVSASSPDEGVQMRELQTSVYKNSSTQLIKLNDGRMMMAWIEDDPNRDDLNRMRLVYSVYSAGSWSEPKAVADDGTNDNTPALATDGETVYIAWQNIKSKTTAADEAAVQQLLQDSEICLAKYNAEEDTFEPAVQLSDNALYDSTPAIAVENGNAAVYWVTATTNDMTQPGNNQIQCYTTADGKTQTVQDNVNNVLSMESAFVNGQPRLAYSADTDGDVSTTEDIETFVLDGSTAASVSAQDDIPDLYLDYGALDGEDVLFFADSTNIYYRQNGETKSVFTAPRAISGELQAVSDNSQTSLLWAESSEEGTDLWMCSYENGAWTEPVQLTSAGKYLHDVSAVYQDGQLCAVLDRTNRLPTEDGGYENGTTDLVYLTMTEYTEIEAGFAALDESQMELGQTYGVPVYIKNNGTKTVDTVKVTLNDGGLLPDVSKEIQVNLPSGADTVVYVDYPVPAEMVRTLFELSVEVVGETEQNTEDNTASQQIGYADISMQDMTVEDVGNYYILTAVLSNDNAVTAQGVQVNICAGSKDGDVLDTLTVGDMQPGDLKSVQYIVDKSTLEYGEEGMQQIYFCASIEQTLTRAANDAAELITEDNAAGAVLAYEEPQGPDEPGDVTLGDVDGNGTVNAADAVMVLRSDAGLTTLTAEQTAAADINGDGTVNASDAVQILRFDAGLIQVL